VLNLEQYVPVGQVCRLNFIGSEKSEREADPESLRAKRRHDKRKSLRLAEPGGAPAPGRSANRPSTDRRDWCNHMWWVAASISVSDAPRGGGWTCTGFFRRLLSLENYCAILGSSRVACSSLRVGWRSVADRLQQSQL